jgi:opacity protein-like surface antigen
MIRRILVGVALLGAVPALAAAQGQFQVGPRIGYTKYAERTAIEAGPMLGLDAAYSVSRNLSIGVRLDFARPVTDGNFFPAEMTFGDTTMLFAVSQPLTVLHYGVAAEFTTGGSFAPFVNAGVGAYRLSLDPQVARGVQHVSDLSFTLGGGIDFQTSPGTQIRLTVQDIIYNNFDRALLNPVDPRFAPVRFPDVIPVQEPFEGVAHNIHVALAFSFTPGGR